MRRGHLWAGAALLSGAAVLLAATAETTAAPDRDGLDFGLRRAKVRFRTDRVLRDRVTIRGRLPKEFKERGLDRNRRSVDLFLGGVELLCVPGFFPGDPPIGDPVEPPPTPVLTNFQGVLPMVPENDCVITGSELTFERLMAQPAPRVVDGLTEWGDTIPILVTAKSPLTGELGVVSVWGRDEVILVSSDVVLRLNPVTKEVLQDPVTGDPLRHRPWLTLTNDVGGRLVLRFLRERDGPISGPGRFDQRIIDDTFVEVPVDPQSVFERRGEDSLEGELLRSLELLFVDPVSGDVCKTPFEGLNRVADDDFSGDLVLEHPLWPGPPVSKPDPDPPVDYPDYSGWTLTRVSRHRWKYESPNRSIKLDLRRGTFVARVRRADLGDLQQADPEDLTLELMLGNESLVSRAEFDDRGDAWVYKSRRAKKR